MLEPSLPTSPVSSLIGIVTYVVDVEMRRGAPEVFVSAAKGPDMALLGHPTGANISGSGAALGPESARGAAIGECLERYAASIVDDEELVIASHRSLTESGGKGHDPSAWALFDPSQQTGYPPFSDDLTIAWTTGWSLCTNERLFVPACLTYLSSSPALRRCGARVIGPSVSTGCACATTRTESLLKGLCELIERDAFMIVWRNRLGMPEVTIDKASAIHETYQSRFARPGLDYRIWETTLDFPVPSFFGILFDHRWPKTRMIVGGAAHPDAELAVQKTLCELVQGLTWLEHVDERAGRAITAYDRVRTFTDRALLYAFQPPPDSYSFLSRDHARIPLSSIPSRRQSPSVLLDHLVEELVDRGYQPCAVDLTTDDIRECGYVVTRVVVPGLETMDGDHRLQLLGGARWRQVPATLGLSISPAGIRDINPYPHPYP